MPPFGKTLEGSSRIVAKLARFALVLVAAAPAKADTFVEFGDVIDAPGVYVLHGNQSGSGPGIKIESDDVVLLLLRFTLRGDGTEIGISAFDHDNVTIWGGRVTNFRTGIALSDGEYCTVRDTRIDHCVGDGLFLRRVDESWFLRLRCDHNGGNGVAAFNCYESRFISILAHDNDRDGILIANQVAGANDGTAGGSSNGNKIRLCWAAYNDRDGIRILDSHDNDLKRNQCVGNEGAGIRLDTFSDSGGQASSQEPETRYNHLEANWCVFNYDGIVVEWGATDNTIFSNTALANHGHDLVENNFELPCVNTWFFNFFLTKDGDGEICIF